MITVLSMNPSIDRTVETRGFAIGATNRILREYSLGSGKGVNVAIVARRLGLPVRCLGLLALEGSESIQDRLGQEGVGCDFVRVSGAVRTNLKIMDLENGVTTELNEPGPVTDEGALHGLMEQVEQIAGASDFLVLTGSLPPGVPEDFYARVMRRVQGRCRCVLDVDGARLIEQIADKPFMIKPNLQELEGAAGKKLSTLREIRDSACGLIRRGVELVVVSMGTEGAMLCDGNLTLFAPALPVKAYATACAGDSMVAGVLYGLANGGNLPDALKCGVAAATATVSNAQGDLMLEADFRTYLAQVRVGTV